MYFAGRHHTICMLTPVLHHEVEFVRVQVALVHRFRKATTAAPMKDLCCNKCGDNYHHHKLTDIYSHMNMYYVVYSVGKKVNLFIVAIHVELANGFEKNLCL